jgi:hypothetical protein
MRQRGEPMKQTRGTNEADRRAYEATKGRAKELDRTRNEADRGANEANREAFEADRETTEAHREDL